MISPERSAKTATLLRGVMLAIAVAIPHLPAVAGGWLWDDSDVLYANPLVTQASGLGGIWRGKDALDFFPLTTTSFWIEYRLWGPWPPGYRAVNVALHAVNAVLVWRVLLGLGVPGAWVAALLWGVHPVTVSSVDWITERKNTLSMFFACLSVLAWMRGEDRGRRIDLAASWGWFVASLLAKTSFVSLPLVLPLISWWRGRMSGGAWRDVLRPIPFLAASLLLGAMTLVLQIGQARTAATDPLAMLGGTLFRGVLVSGRAVWFSLSKDLLPVRLAMIYPSWTVDTRSAAAFVPSLVVVVVLAALWWGRRRSWAKAAFFAFAVYVLLMLPVLGFLPATYMRSYAYVADQWRYAALVAPVALVVSLATAVLRDRTSRTVAAALAASVLAALTARHARLHADGEWLWRHNIAVSDSWAGHVQLGFHLVERGRAEEALAEARKSLAKYGPRTGTWILVAHSEVALGHVDEASAAYIEAWKASSDERILAQAAVQLSAKGYFAAAEPFYAKAMEYFPDDIAVRGNYGRCLEELGRHDEAEASYRSILDRSPDDATALNALAFLIVMHRPGDAVEALDMARRASRLTGDADAAILDTLATALAATGDFTEATRVLDEALRRARSDGDESLVREIEAHRRLFAAGRPLVAP